MDNNNIYLDFLRQLSENGSAVDNDKQNNEQNKYTEQQTNNNNQADAPAVTEVRDDMDKAFDNTNAFEKYEQELQNRTKYHDASNEKLLGVVSDVAKGNKPYYHLSMQGQQDAYEAQKELSKRLASGDIAYDVQPKKEVAKNKSGYYIYDPENEHNEFLNLSDQQLSAKMKETKSKLESMSGKEDDYEATFKIAEKLNEAITYRNESHEANDPALRSAIEKENKRKQEQQQKAIESTDSYQLNSWVKKNLTEDDKNDTIYSSTGYNLGAQSVHGKSKQEAIQIALTYTQDDSHSLSDKKNFVRGVLNSIYENDGNPEIPRYLGENMLRANIKNAKTEEEKSDSTKVYDEYVKIVQSEAEGTKNSYVQKAENEALAKFIASYKKASAENAKLAEDNYDNSFGFLRDEDDIETANLKRASQYLTGVDIAGLIRQSWESMDQNTMRAYAVRLAESRGEMTEQGIQKAQNEIVDTFYKDCIKYVKDDIPEGAFGVIQNAFANSIAGNLWQGAIRGGNVNNNELTLLDLYQQRLQEQDQNYAKNGWSGAANLITSKAFQMGFDTPFFGGIGRVASTATKPLLKPFVSLAVGKWVPKAVYKSAFNAFASTGGGRLMVGVTSGAITGALFNPISMGAQSLATGQSASVGDYLSGAMTGAFHFGAMGFTPIIGNRIITPINKMFSGTGKAQTIARTMGNVVVQDVISPGLNAAIVTGLENWREIARHGISPDLVTEYERTFGEFLGMHLGGKVSHIGNGKLVSNLKSMYGYKTALQQQGFTKSELEAINNSEAVSKIKQIINEYATIGDAEMKQISELHKDIIADNTIPEGAKLKLFAIIGDSAIATPTITNVERVEEGGKHVVKVYTAEGKLFSANEFSSKSQADNEVKRISNITEKNKILATQSTFDAVWFQQVTNDATRALAEAKGVDVTEMSKQLGEIAERSNSGAELSSEDKSLLKEFDDAIKTAVNNTTLQNSEQLKNSYKNVGVSIDDILSKDYSQWTKSDKELVERYVDTMNSAIAKDNERKDAMIRRREVASIIKQSFDEGNSLEGAQSINDTALRVNALENSIGDHLTDELRSEILNDPVSAYERVYNDENLSAPVKERILEYITTRAKFDGFVSSVNDRIDSEVEASNTAIDAITHKSEGNVIEVELTDNAGVEKGKKVYVINGYLSIYGDYMVDYDKSDKTIAIIVEGDEKPRMISPSKIVRVVNNNSAEELKNSAREEIVARISAESNNAVNGTIDSVSVGDKISIANDEGNVVEAEVVQPTDKKGNPIAPKDGEVFIKVGEDIFSISLEQLSIRAGNAKYYAISNEYRIEAEPTSEDGIRVDLAKDEAEENVAPELDKTTDEENIHQQAYKPGQFTLREGGEDKLAIVTGNVDEQGRIQYLVQGENEFRYATNEQMRELAKDYKPYEEAEAEGNTMPKAEAKEVVNAEQREAENEAEAVEQKVADEFPVDENGKKDYVSAGAERTAKHIYEELELEKENADELVDNNIASATEELAKAEKAKGEALKGVTDPDEMAALQKSANEAVAKAKQKKELWEAVKAERAKQNEENNETTSLPDASENVQLADSKLRKLNDEYAEADKVFENHNFKTDKEYWDNMRRIDAEIEGELNKLGDDDLSEIAKNFGGQVGNRAERILHKRKVDSLMKLSDEDLLEIVDEKGELWEEARDILDGKEAAKSDIQRYNELLDEQGEISGKAKKNYSLNKYTDKKGRPQLRGVYHKDGYAIASDTHVLVADKRKYDKENDGKIIDKDGNEIELGYPNAFAVVPRRIISSDIDAMDLLNFIAGVKEIVKSKKEKLKDKVILLNFGGELWAGNVENFEKFANAAVSLGGKIYFNDNVGTGIYTRPIYTESDKGFAIMMPVDYTRNSIDKENYFAYKPAEPGSETDSIVGKEKHQFGEGGELRMAQELTDKSMNDMQTIARSLGVELVFDESLKENGRYTTIDQKTGKPTIHVAMNASNPLESVFGHEATHRVKSLDNESYGELHDVARLMIGDEKFFDRANQKKALYAKNGITLSDADAREEVVSDYIGSLIYDKEHMGKVAGKLSKPILSKIRDVVSDFLDYFRRNKMTADERLAKGSLRAIDRAFANAANSVLNYADGTKYSLVEDKDEIDRLNKEEVEIGYQNIELKDDLSVGSPMASRLKNKGKGRVVTSDSQFGKWAVSEENPDMVNENGKIDLVRPDGGSVPQVDYNPYFHIRPYLFNKQFDKAWERPRLVFIETQFPKSELSSGFKAYKAKKSVGRHDWNGGELILSRWTKPKAIVPWREVAPHWIEEFKDSGVKFNKVPPAILNTLRDNGVKILPPKNGMGKNCFEAYEAFKKGDYNPEYITDEQIDAFNEKINSGNTQSDKFSIRANEELEKKSLVGIHNLTDDNLRYAIKLGGLANPSTAVVDTDIMGLEGFGDISMIMPKSLVDKRTGKNLGTYAGDAYTPRFPNGDIVKHISSRGVEKINQDYQGNDQFSRDFREALRSYGSEYGGITPTLYYLYKLENGGADVVKHEGPKIKSEAHRMMIDKYGEKEWSELSDADKQELVEYRREEIMESLKDVEKSKAEKLVDKLINSSDFDTLAYKKFRSLKMDYNEQKNAGDIDYQGTYNKAQNDVIMSGEHDKFAKWLDEKSIRYEIEDRIFRGYTPSGNRKYAPLTLLNISKVMKESGRAGSEAMMSGSPHSLRGKMLPLYKTLESINKNKGMLSDEETYERIRGEIENEYNELIGIIMDIKGVDYNDAYYVLEDALLKGFNYAEREAGITIDNETKERISAFGELLKESPVKYFETKFERPVMLNEFVAAVVPKDIDAELKKSLIDNGIAIEEYERGNEESRLDAIKRASNREDVKFSIRDDGSMTEGTEETKPLNLRSILNDRNIGLKEQITLSKALFAEQNKSDKTLLNDFVRSVTDNLSDVRKAMSAQKVYDKSTVKRVADLAKIMLYTGHLRNLGEGEQQRLLSAIKNSTGANNNDESVQKIMDIMVSNQLKNGELALEALERKKGTRLDSTRVQHVGELDPAGNIMLDAFKNCRRMSDEKLSEQIGEYLSKMDSNDEAIADNASNAYAGAMIARMYHEKIRTSIEDEQTLQDELKNVSRNEELKKNNRKTYRQLVDSIKDAITQNRIDRAQAYYDLVGMLTNKMKDSAENAKQFKEAEKQRVKNIHHIANSDMQGRKLRGDRKDNTLEGINNFPVFRFLASPLANLDQMLRMLGGKNSYGRGYLWNHFMRGWADSADKEQVATEKYYDMLDKKAAEIFGEKGYVFDGNTIKRAYRYTDLYSYAEDLPKATISYLDGGEMREYALSQAELLYLYAVEKMPLGRATNRKMGISEDVMEQITNVLDEKLKRFADWTQEELLPSLGNEMNAVHRRMFGANMDSIENYFPFVRDKKAIKVEVENGNLKNFNDKISVKTGAIKKRTANVIKWDMPNCNFFKVLAKHVDEGCHWMGFSEINKDFSTLLSYNRFKQQVMNINSVYGNGSTLWKTFANVCAIATDAYEPQRSESDELMVRIAKNVTLSKIAFNPMPAIKQLLSLPAFFGEVKPQYVMQSLLRGGVVDVKWAWENLPNYRKRVKSRMIGDYYLRDSEFEKKGGIVGLLQTAGDKFESLAKKGMIANIGIDAWTIAVGAYGAYRTAKDKYIRWGMSEEKAEERAKQDATLCYNKSQQSSEGPFMSKVQIDHTFFSTMMMLFRNAATSYTRETHASLRNLKRLVSGEVDYEYMAKQILRQAEIPTFRKLFDSELNRQAEGTLANDHDYSLGTPGGKLQSSGVLDKPIKLFPELLSAVAEQNGLELKYFSGLVDAINNPVAVFNEDGQTRIVVETDGGNDHCIIDIQPNEEGYRVTNIEPLSNHPDGYKMIAESLLDLNSPKYINQGKAKRMLKMSGVLSEFNKEDKKAIRNIANNFENPMVPEQQNLSVWRKEDIDNAKKQAKREIVDSTAKNIVNTAIFGLVLPWAWRIGGAASLLLLSDDDDAKQEVIDDANRKAVTSGLEGIAYGDVVTDGLHVLWDRFVNGNKDAKLAYLGRNNPFYSDMSTMLRHMDRDVMQGCADIINIFISSMTGVNPQLVSNWTAAWMDKASGNRELSNEWGLFAARLVNTPKSQLENIYFEEVGLMGSEVSNYTPEQLAMRFANYQVRRGYSIIPSSCVGDSAFTKQKNYAFKIIKEKMNNSIDKDTQQKYEQFSASINEGKKKVGEAKNKYINGVIDGAQLFASLQYSKDYDIYRKYAKYDAELTKVVNLYLNCESTKEAKFLINSIRDIRRNLVESYDATLIGDTDKENASATKLDESVSKFWDDYYEMNPKALEKEQRKREVNKALSNQ